MPQRNVASNFTFEQQRVEINNLAQDFWTQKGTVDTAASTYLKHDGTNAFTGQSLAVPNAFTINSNSGSGTVTISGNLDVTGTTTTVSSANLEVTDKNILIAKGSTSDSQADGAGITIDSATDITWNFIDANDALVSSIGVEATTHLKAARGQFTGSTSPTTGQGIEINAPDANTGQIISYDRGGSAYKELRLRASSVPIYTGTTNALVGSFSSTGLTMESGKTITGVIATAGQPNITSVGTLTVLAVGGDVTVSRTGLAVNKFESTDNHSRLRINSGNASYAQLEFGDQADVDAGEIRYSNTSNSSDYMAFHVGNNVEHMRLTQNGLLELLGVQRFQAYDNNSGGGGYNATGLVLGNAYDAGKTTGITDDRNAIIWQERGLDLDFGTQDTFRMKLTYDGKLCLGTNTSNTSDSLTIMDPGNAFMSLRSDQHADGVGQHIDFCVGTTNRASGNMVGAIRAQVPTGTTSSGTLHGELSFWSNSGDNISQNMTLHPDGSLTIGTATKQLGTRLTADGNIKMTQATSNTRRIFALPGTAAYALNSSGGCAIGFTRDANNNDFLIFETHTQGASHAERMRLTQDGYLHLGGVSQGTNKVGGQNITGQDFDPIFKLLTQTNNTWLMQLRSDVSAGSNGIFLRAGSGTDDYTMYLTGKDENNKHLLVRGDGYVQKPKNPGFAVQATPTSSNFTNYNNSWHSFGTVHYNNGNHYDNASGRFTAPIDGYYFFTCGLWCSNADDPNGSYVMALLRENSNGGGDITFAGASHRHEKNQLTCSGGIYMTGGQTVRIEFNGSIVSSTPRNYFTGCLIG